MSHRFEPLCSSKLFDTRPAVYAENRARIRFPILGSYKYDGWRLFEYNRQPHTRSLKLPKNYSAVRRLSEFYSLVEVGWGIRGLDGEAVVGPVNAMNAMQATTSGLGSYDGEPNITYLVFDSYQFPDKPYQERFANVQELVTFAKSDFPWVQLVKQIPLHNWDEVDAFLAEALELGYEGIMLRSPDAIYKMGRSTLRDGGILTALKPFVDDEAEILEVIEQMHNANEAEEDNYGRMRRSSHQENLVPKGTMGSVRCKSKRFEETFTVGYGKGLDDALRKWLWEHRFEVPGQILSYEFQEVGSKDRPRHPRWRSIRAREDLPV